MQYGCQSLFVSRYDMTLSQMTNSSVVTVEKVPCANGEDSDRTARSRSPIRVLAVRYIPNVHATRQFISILLSIEGRSPFLGKRMGRLICIYVEFAYIY